MDEEERPKSRKPDPVTDDPPRPGRQAKTSVLAVHDDAADVDISTVVPMILPANIETIDVDAVAKVNDKLLEWEDEETKILEEYESLRAEAAKKFRNK